MVGRILANRVHGEDGQKRGQRQEEKRYNSAVLHPRSHLSRLYNFQAAAFRGQATRLKRRNSIAVDYSDGEVGGNIVEHGDTFRPAARRMCEPLAGNKRGNPAGRSGVKRPEWRSVFYLRFALQGAVAGEAADRSP
jgi:hypothetical protein